MTLKIHLQHALAAMTHFSTGQETVDVSDGPRHLQAELTALDTLACSFTRLSLRADSLKNRSPSELKRIAEQLSGKLTYLLEPISPIETDAEGCVVQMRSNPPQKEADCTSYYELLVARTGELSLARYSRNSGQLREVVAAHVSAKSCAAWREICRRQPPERITTADNPAATAPRAPQPPESRRECHFAGDRSAGN